MPSVTLLGFRHREAPLEALPLAAQDTLSVVSAILLVLQPLQLGVTR
jgi:hypothetical protein